jgi:hypothetical protein
MSSKHKKHDTMNGMKQLFLSVVICAAIFSPKLYAQENSILVDKIAATVNEEIITLIDIDKAIRFFPVFRKAHDSEDLFYSDVLEDLINYKVIYLEHKNDYSLKEEDYVQVQTEAIDKLGSLEKFMQVLRSFGMKWQDFKSFVREKVVYEKVLARQLQVGVTIGFKEIEAFYNNQYLPTQERLGLKPWSLIRMTSQIENHLKKIRTRERLAGWIKEIRSSYRVRNKLIREQEDGG